jgi:hypothetical protein
MASYEIDYNRPIAKLLPTVTTTTVEPSDDLLPDNQNATHLMHWLPGINAGL